MKQKGSVAVRVLFQIDPDFDKGQQFHRPEFSYERFNIAGWQSTSLSKSTVVEWRVRGT